MSDLPEGFQPEEAPIPEGFLADEDVLRAGIEIPQQVTSRLTRTLEAGAPGSEMGREQAALARSADPLGLSFPGLGPAPATQAPLVGPESLTEPFIKIPSVSSTDPRFQAFLTGATGQVPTEETASSAAAALNVAKSLPEFAETGVGVLTGPLGYAEPAAAKLIGAGFAGQMIPEVPEAARQAGRLSVEGTPQERKEAYLGLGSNIVLPALLGAPALEEAGRALRRAPAAAPVPPVAPITRPAPVSEVRTVEPPAPPVTPSPTVQPLPAETGAPVTPPRIIGSAVRLKDGTIIKSKPGESHTQAMKEAGVTRDQFSADARDIGFYTADQDFIGQYDLPKQSIEAYDETKGAAPAPLSEFADKPAGEWFTFGQDVQKQSMAGKGPSLQIIAEQTALKVPDEAAWQAEADKVKADQKALLEELAKDPSQMMKRQNEIMGLGQKGQFFAEGLKIIRKQKAPEPAAAAAAAPVAAPAPAAPTYTGVDATVIAGKPLGEWFKAKVAADLPAAAREELRQKIGAKSSKPSEILKRLKDQTRVRGVVSDLAKPLLKPEEAIPAPAAAAPAPEAAPPPPAPAPAPAPEKFPNTGVGAPADAFGAIYGPKLTPDQISRFKNQEGEQFDIPSEGGFTTTLKVKRNMLWMETSQKVPGTTSTYDVGVAYMHIRPDGTTVLDASKHGRPIDKAAAASLMRFLQRTGEKEATPTPPAALPPTPPVPAAPAVKLSESDMRDLVSDLTQLSRRSDLDVEERANVSRAIEAARMGNPTEGLALRDRLKELAVPKTKLVKGIKFGGTGERIPDLIDWLKDAFPSGVKITSKSDYGRLVDEATGAAREVLFKNKGASVDTVMKAAELEGMHFASQDDFINAVLKAGSGRTETGARLSAEERMLEEEAAQVEEFQATALRNRGRTPAEKKAATPVPVENLKVGDKFTIKGEQFTVSEVTPEGDVITDDGKRFGRQALRDGQTIHPDRGEVIGEPEAAEEPVPTPKERVKEEVQKVQDYAAGMVQSAGIYIRRSIDAGRTPEQAGLDWAREIGMGMMDVPDDIYLRERGGFYTSTYVKGVFNSREGVALNAKEYLKAVDEGRQEGKSRIGMGAAVRSEAKATGPRGEELPTYGVAARVLEKQRQAGTIIPVEPGEGVSPEEQIQRGRDLLAAGANAENIMAEMERTKKFNADEAAILRAHGELLDQAFFAASDKFGPNSPVAEKALEDYSAWQKRFKNLSTEWHRTGQTLQGETEIDTGTFHGLRKAWIDATGKDFTPDQAGKAEKIAKGVKGATEEADKAKADTLAEVGKSAATETGKRPAAPKPGEVGSPDAATLWKRAKELLDAGEDDFDNLRQKLSQEFGIPMEEVYRKLTEPKSVRTISDDMYRKMANRRKLVNEAKDWLRNEQSPGWIQFIRKVPRVFFVDKILGHGTVGMITHAGLNIFNPGAWRTYWPNFFRQYRLIASKAYHERMMQDLLRDPLFTKARRAGLANDPHRVSDDYQNPTFVRWLDRLGLTGNRGFDALKLFRQARFNQIWNSLPESLQTPGYAKLLADGVNHATGAIRRPFREWANWTFFAPRLEASRWAWMVKDPWDAAKTFVDWEKATPEARAFAMSQLKEKAAIAGTYYTLLMMNQGLLEASGSDQRINFTNPRRGDFLAFKAAGHNIGIVGPMLGMVRLFANLYHAAAGTRGKVESLTPRAAEFGQIGLEYARGKLSPFAGFGMDVISQADFQGRPMPFSSDKTPKYLRRQGLGPYTYGEYAAQEFTPIPASEAVREVWRAQGMGEEMQDYWLKVLTVGLAAGLTGARVSTESPPSPTKQ